MTSKHEHDHKEIEQDTNEFSKFFTKHKIIILIILVFILAFAVRGHLLKYDYMFEFDPYWHLRATGYVLQGDLPDNDPLGFYQQGGSDYGNRPQFLWKFTSLIYLITTFGAAYDKWLLMSYARVLPALFGALIAVAMYFLGKEVYNRKAGMVMAVISATIPAFVYRTMAGFFEEDALGFLWLVLGFIFFIKAIKNAHATKLHLTYGVISAIFFGLMAFTWDMFLLIPLVMVLYFIGNIIYMAYKNASNKEIASFVKIFLVVFIIFFALASLYHGTAWVKRTTQYVTQYLPVSQDNVDRVNKTTIAESDVLGASVGEENTGKQFFLLKYNFMVWIPFLVVILIPLYLLFSKKKDYRTLLIFFWILVTLFMAWSKLKFTFTLGIPIAAGAGFLFYILDEWVKRNKTLIAKRTLAIFTIILVLCSIGAGTHFVSTKVPPIDEANEWRNSIFWLYDNTPEDAKIFNWWDYGHWIAYFAERKVSTDNTNSFIEADADFGMFMITNDLNTSKNLLKQYDSDYFIVDSGYFRRYNSFASYAYLTTNYSDPKVSKYFGNTLGCSPGMSEDKKIAYKCGGNVISEDEFNKISDTWLNTPSDIINGTPIFIYRAKDNSELYILNSAVNESIFAKIWLSEPSVDGYATIVHQEGNVRIYQVNKEFLN